MSRVFLARAWWSWRVIELLCQAPLANGQALFARPSKENSKCHRHFSPSRSHYPSTIKKSPTHKGLGFFWWSWRVMLPRPMVNVRTYYKRSLFKILGNYPVNKQKGKNSGLEILDTKLKQHFMEHPENIRR